jgi:hypothetical protein
MPGREELRVRARGMSDGGAVTAVEIAVPESVRARAEEIVRLSRGLGAGGAGFTSPADVLAPALVYGLAHMKERYAQAALRRAIEDGDEPVVGFAARAASQARERRSSQ